MRNIIIGFVMLSQCAASYAALGGAPSDFSTAPDGRKARVFAANPAGATGGARYQIRESTLDSGTTVREFTGGDGQVFAISWNGPIMPDLRTLLGKHFDTLIDEAGKKPKAGNSRLDIRRGEVVIESGGHMRAYAGRAWIPAQLPAGFSSDDIN